MADLDGTTFLTGANAGFIAELYARFLEDPNTVDESWRRFFSEIGDDAAAALAELRGPAWGQLAPRLIPERAAPRETDAEAISEQHYDTDEEYDGGGWGRRRWLPEQIRSIE